MTPNLTAAPPTPHLLLADLTLEQAKPLDDEIRNGIQAFGRGTFDFNVTTGRALAKFHAGRGYKALSYPTWKAYLGTMPDFGITQLTYMVRIGEAVELNLLNVDAVKADGMNGSILLLFGQMTDRLDKMQALMDVMWPQMKGKAVRDAEKLLRDFVDQHWDEYHTHPKRAGHEPHTADHSAKWETEFRGLDATGQADFIKQMWDFLEHHDPGNHPQPSTN